jgi:hypothetical protein
MYNIPTRIFTDLYLKSKRQHFRVFVYKSNLYFFFIWNCRISKKKNSSNLFVTISAFVRGICTRKCEQILCPGTFMLFISTNGCLYNFFYYTNQTYIFFFHMKLQNFEFKNYLNHYLKRSDHFLGTLKFLHTVSVSSSDSLVIGCNNLCICPRYLHKKVWTNPLSGYVYIIYIYQWMSVQFFLHIFNKKFWLQFIYLITLKDQTNKNVSKFSRNMFTEIMCEIFINHFVEIIFTLSCTVVDI